MRRQGQTSGHNLYYWLQHCADVDGPITKQYNTIFALTRAHSQPLGPNLRCWQSLGGDGHRGKHDVIRNTYCVVVSEEPNHA